MFGRGAARARTARWGVRGQVLTGAHRYKWAFGALAALGLAWSLAGCTEADVEQLKICQRLIPAIEAEDAQIEVVRGTTDPAVANAVRVEYRVIGANGASDGSWISCRFGGSGFARDRLRLTGVVTARDGALSEIAVFMLRRYWLDLYEAQAPLADGAAEGGRSWSRDLLYFMQLVVNGLSLGCLYGLLAIGYTLVYGVIGRINLAFGEIAIIGAYTTFLAVAVLALLGLGPLPLALLAVLALVGGVGAVYGLATERLVFRPLREVPSQAPLIATLGLAIFLQEALRLLQGADDRWVQPLFSGAHQLSAAPGFALTVNTSQIIVIALAVALYAALWLVMARTGFGRTVRACADDVAMAALCGVNIERTVALTFALGSAYAAIAGFVVLLRYGGVSFHEGFLLGFKALTAAIVGGIGSVPGAMLGGILIGALEICWAGYLNLAYRDVATFAVLAAVLIWRPHGLLGQPVRLANDAFRPRPI
jgi:branched-chain amino acid transport system permease protein